MLTNAQLWNASRNASPNFRSLTSKVSRDFFTERGFSQLDQIDPSIKNDYFRLSVRVILQKIDIAEVKDPLEAQGFGVTYNMAHGGISQRIAIGSVKQVSPAYKNLQDRKSVDQQIVRKNPNISERFFTQNNDFQSLITIPDDALYKNMFAQEFGMSQYIGGVLKGMMNGWIQHQRDVKLAALNAALNSTSRPLQDSQKYEIDITTMSATDVTTADAEVAYANQFIGFVQLVRNLVDAMTIIESTAYNVAKFETVAKKENLKLLMRPELANAMETIMRLNSADNMALPVDIVKVPNFGGLEPYSDANFQTRVYEVYDETLGDVIGYATTEGATTPNVDKVYWKDPNEKIISVLADREIIFDEIQNPLQIRNAPPNARGMYTNMFANAPNNATHFDTYYPIVAIYNSHQG